MGMSTDYVKVGDHADLGFGFTLPLLGIGLPDRNLTADERGRAEQWIRKLYGEFVGKVADGRDMKSEAVDSIGQGRVWSGMDGKKVGLVDVLGGMDAAIRIARIRAGIADDDEATVVELPRPAFLDLSALLPSPVSASLPLAETPWMDHLMFRLRHNGVPMPVVPLEDWEAAR
jgi:protease IV